MAREFVGCQRGQIVDAAVVDRVAQSSSCGVMRWSQDQVDHVRWDSGVRHAGMHYRKDV
jgi:chitinase